LNHYATRAFWDAFHALDIRLQQAAREAYQLMKANPRHPSLQLKKVGRFWSARVDLAHRAVAVEAEDGLVWIWIGHHSPYERTIR